MTDEIHRLRVAVDMYRRIVNDNEAQIKLLREAIAKHRRDVLAVSVSPLDVELWRALDD